MGLFLFTDYGAADLYVGQIKAQLIRHAPDVPVIDLLHDAPAFNVKAGAHLLAALAPQIPYGSVTLAVVDPGVGGARNAVAVEIGGRWFVGPDNGLLSVLAARADLSAVWRITWQPENMAPSFHGRDLFAPVAAALARTDSLGGKAIRAAGLTVDFGAGDLAEIIYVDHYGNAFTGLRAYALTQETRVVAGARTLEHAHVFSAVPSGAVFWYVNSLGLVEIAGNGCSAAAELGLAIGQAVDFSVEGSN